MSKLNKDETVWFAMSAPFRKECEAKRLLDKRNIESFVPMYYNISIKKNGTKTRELVPYINNLIFVKTTRQIIQEVKGQILILQYYTRPEKGKNVPIIVPESQMRQFIAITKKHNEKLVYLKPEEIDLKRGTRVRIHGGPFDGIEGVFVKVQGIRSRRVVVLIEGVAAVVMAEVKPDLIEVVNESKDKESTL